MAQTDFISLVPVSKSFVNRKKNTVKQGVQWLQIKWIRVQKDKPLQFQYRYSLNALEAWKTVDLRRRAKGRPPDLGRIPLPKLYTTSRPIKAGKKTDLLSLTSYLQFIMLSTTAFYRAHMETVKIPNTPVVKTVTMRKTRESKVMVIVSRSKNTMSSVSLTLDTLSHCCYSQVLATLY